MTGMDVGDIRGPCENNSRWHQFAFTNADIGKEVTFDSSGSVTLILVNGEVRTEMDSESMNFGTTSPVVICAVTETFEGQIKFGSGSDCSGKTKNQLIKFDVTAPPADSIVVTAPESSFVDLEKRRDYVKLLSSSTARESCPTRTDVTLFALAEPNNYYVYDPRVDRFDNEIENPAVTCSSNVRKNFVNKQTCVTDTSACQDRYSEAAVTLDSTTILKFYALGQRHVHYVEGLTTIDLASPCKAKQSRWLKIGSASSCSDDATDATIKSVVEAAILDSSDAGGDIVDINIKGDCSDSSDSAVGAVVAVGSSCYEHSHPNEHDIYDFTYWSFTHPGNLEAFKGGRVNPIAQVALDLNPKMAFPSWHPIPRWEQALRETQRNSLKRLGRLGDTIDFNELPEEVQIPEIADHFGAIVMTAEEGGFELCGSPGEVSEVPALGMRFATVTMDQNDSGNQASKLSDQRHAANEAKEMVWTNLALRASDQLRQRVAWALSQILVVSADGAGGNNENEKFLAYYDIFVRHAFGNYKDVMREVTYSPVMGSMLSYTGSRSFASMLKSTGNEIYPDENYARELMQLFTIGLFKLRMDGTRVLGADGKPVESYDNDEIITFARVWTGFQRQDSRGNIEMSNGDGSTNNIDPMKIQRDFHDVFPKADTVGGYLGDTTALCEDILGYRKAFLKKGAVYRYLGRSSQPVMQYDHKDMATHEIYLSKRKKVLKQMDLDPVDSSLYAALCNKDSSGKCQFKSEAVLDVGIQCNGHECLIQQPRVVRLNVTSSTGEVLPTFFEYIRPPCVDLMFPENPTLVTNHNGVPQACANPKVPAAVATCCPDSTTRCWTSAGAGPEFVYLGERVTQKEAVARCERKGLNAISFSKTDYDYSNTFWNHQPCHVQIQVNPDGLVARVDDMDGSGLQHVKIDNRNYFHVHWKGGVFPKVEDNCRVEALPPRVNETVALPPCRLHVRDHGGSSCLCNITVDHSIPFDSTSRPTRDEILSTLSIGSVVDAAWTASDLGEVLAYQDSDGGIVSFEVIGGAGQVKHLKNLISSVTLERSSLGFRNPPHFMSLTEPTQRDAVDDVDALLDHLFYHPNTAPFISHRFIQRFTTSNPSPRYISSVAHAFKSGSFEGFGSGDYGDLGATIAAVLLDREASTPLLDADPHFGSVREPIIKILHLLRSMEYAGLDDEEVELRNMEDVIGQMSWESPTVFNYYEPSFVPHQLASHRITAPEMQLLNAPFTVSWLNGVTSLIRYGLTRCWGGFDFNGRTNCGDVDKNKKKPSELTGVAGSLTFLPTPLPEPVQTAAPAAAPALKNRTCINDETWVRFNFDTNASYSGQDCEFAGERRALGQTWVCDEFGTSMIDQLGRTDWEACPVACGSCPAVVEGLIRGEQAIDEMSLLLTGGRLSDHARQIIVAEYEKELSRYGDEEKAMRVAQQLLVITPEFHSTSLNDIKDEGGMREVVEEEVAKVPSDYKAVVYLMMFGAADSYNFIIPHSGCGEKDMYENYAGVRGGVALGKNEVLQIPANTEQVCDTFGLHPKFKHLKQMYDDGDASLVANVGVLTEPITQEEFQKKSDKRPPSLFAHNSQAQALHTAQPQDPTGSGWLGRTKDVLVRNGLTVGSYSIDGNAKVLETDESSEANVISRFEGVVPFDPGGQMTRLYPAIANLINAKGSSLLCETYASSLQTIFDRTEKLEDALKDADVTQVSDGARTVYCIAL